MKTTAIISTASRNAFRSGLRTTLTALALVIGAFTLTITSAIGAGVSGYIDDQFGSLAAHDVISVTKTDETPAAPGDAPAQYDPHKPITEGYSSLDSGFATAVLTSADLNAVTRTEGILEASPVVMVEPRYIESPGAGKYELTVELGASAMRADLVAGSQLDPHGNKQLLLPNAYVESLGFSDAQSTIGEKVSVGIADYLGTTHEVEAVISGVQNLSLLGTGARFNQALTDELYRVQNTGKPDGAGTGYYLATARVDANTSEEEMARIKADLASQGYTARTAEDQLGVFKSVIDGIIGVLNAFAVIALIAAGIGIVNTLLMSVQERTREIGLMKAMGMSGGKVFALFSTEAVVIGFLGSAVGALLAIVVGSLTSDALSETVLADLTGLRLLQFEPASVAVTMLTVMLIAFLAGTLPARRAARQRPIDALRYE